VSPHSANPAWSSRDAREWPEREVYQPRGDDRETGPEHTGSAGTRQDWSHPCGSVAPCGWPIRRRAARRRRAAGGIRRR